LPDKKKTFPHDESLKNVDFLPPVSYDTNGIYPSSVVVADVNGDGKPDLVVLNDYIQPNDSSAGTFGILLGNGDGTFQPVVLTTINQSVGEFNGLAVADVNRDGKLDVVVATCCQANGDASAAVFLGNGDGTFQPATFLDTGTANSSFPIAVADLTGNGNPDIVTISWNSGTISVLLGNGDGTFQPPLLSPAPIDPSCLVIADVNNDGKPDLLICGEASVVVLLGNGNGTFQPFTNTNYATGFCNSVAVADFNGDDLADIVSPNTGPSGCPSEAFASVLLGNGNGFQPEANYVVSSDVGPGALAVGDLNGDGKPDIIVSSGLYGTSQVSVLLGNGDGTFQAPTLFESGGQGAISVAVADFNGDGKPDLAVANFVSDTVDVLLNTSAKKTSTTTSVVSAPNPSIYGEAVTYTATVGSSGGAPPNGETVAFYNGSATLGPGELSGGVAPLSTSSLLVGQYSISAAYGGDVTYAASSSSAFTQKVNTAATTTALASSANPARIKRSVNYTATVSSQFGVAATGIVAFQDGGVTVATIPVTNNQAVFGAYYTKQGVHLITAAYSGDTNNQGSLSSVLEEGVGNVPFASVTKVATSGSPSLIGQPVTFTATVTSALGTIPNGELVTFSFHGTEIGTGVTLNGIASITTSALPAKADIIKATYSGDSAFRPSSGTVEQIVDRASTTTTLTSSLNPSNAGQPVTFTATVTSTAQQTSTGNVTFKDGTTEIGTAALTRGVASLTKSSLAVGTHPITAEYDGDSESAKSTSPTLDQVVN
jgi:hypothetical protein